MKRIFLIVLDSCGAGEMPDAAKFGDFGVNTLKSCSTSSKLHIPTMVHCGLGNIEGLSFLGKRDPAQTGACARMAEASMGKDTTIGHWEIAGVVSPNPLPTYPDGFPEEVLKPFREATGRGVSGERSLVRHGGHSRSTARSTCARETSSFTPPQTPCSRSPRTRTSSRRSSFTNTAASRARSCVPARYAVGRVIARPFVGDQKHRLHPHLHTATTFRSSRPQTPCSTRIKAAGLRMPRRRQDPRHLRRPRAYRLSSTPKGNCRRHDQDLGHTAARDFHGPVLCESR